jgi:pimeloyl-ACP methyl ester carboxylesterase
MQDAPFYPVVYIRGYAGSRGAVEETVADPYMGFNLGSTKLRQAWTGDVERHIFESPLIRLMKDHGYTDVFRDGDEIPPEQPVARRSLWIYRYYEPVSTELGSGERPEMEDYARGLERFIEHIRDRLCGPASDPSPAVQFARAGFRIYLVAHSMGGLIARCYLQNLHRGKSHPVARLVTYGTPHGGIDFRLVGNIPDFLRLNNTENFNENRIREYLKLSTPAVAVNDLDGQFPPDRVFCLVGTNRRDYEVAYGLSSAAVGPMSDGLVQIANASTRGSPRAFLHRAHSGHYGLVNSEEGYQNLTRFLFGDLRVDGLLEVDELTLPPAVQRRKDQGRAVRASYHIEVIARVRGARWDLHRRLTEEESAIFRSYDSLIVQKRPVHLFSTFLAGWGRVRTRRHSLGFSLDLGILVPEYTVDGALFLDDHYAGGHLFRDKLNLELTPGEKETALRYGWDSDTPNRATRRATLEADPAGGHRAVIPVHQPRAPGIRARLVLRARDHDDEDN